MNAKNPKEDNMFLTKWKNKLDIGDASLHVLRHECQKGESRYKELVISYKTININTYNVTVMDISDKKNTQVTLFRHESF